MASVDIDGTPYITYADLDEANEYAEAATHAANFRSASDDDKGRALVTATRTLDRQLWLDEYNTFYVRAGITDIINASIEMAISLMDGVDFQNQQNTGELVRSMSAGSVSISNFRGTYEPTRFPLAVQELLRGYLGGSGALTYMPKATGVDGVSVFPLDFGFTSGGGV